MNPLLDSINSIESNINKIINDFIKSIETYGDTAIITEDIYFLTDSVYLEKGKIGKLIRNGSGNTILHFQSNKNIYEITASDIIQNKIELLSKYREDKIDKLLKMK